MVLLQPWVLLAVVPPATAVQSLARACAQPLRPARLRAAPRRACQASMVLDEEAAEDALWDALGGDETCKIDERCIYFVTGNAKKEREVNSILTAQDLRPFRVQHVDIDLPELQGDPLEIARQKCREAASRVQASVIVEDTSLCFNALNGMPGPYIKWFVDAVGNEGLCRMLDGHTDKSAFCQCTLAFSPGPGADPLVFVGRTEGTIVAPLGESGFGWDAIFVPKDGGGGVPFGAMTLEAKNEISHRARALAQLVAHCKENEDGILELMSEAFEDE